MRQSEKAKRQRRLAILIRQIAHGNRRLFLVGGALDRGLRGRIGRKIETDQIPMRAERFDEQGGIIGRLLFRVTYVAVRVECANRAACKAFIFEFLLELPALRGRDLRKPAQHCDFRRVRHDGLREVSEFTTFDLHRTLVECGDGFQVLQPIGQSGLNGLDAIERLGAKEICVSVMLAVTQRGGGDDRDHDPDGAHHEH